MIWLIGNGHGVETKGKRSPIWKDGTQLFEWQFTRAIVKQLLPMLDKMNIEYVNLVPISHDFDNVERVNIANLYYFFIKRLGLKCMYLSIHGNGFDDSEKPNGVETHYASDYASAKIFQTELVEQTGWADRGVIKSNFTVLTKTLMPAVIMCPFPLKAAILLGEAAPGLLSPSTDRQAHLVIAIVLSRISVAKGWRCGMSLPLLT